MCGKEVSRSAHRAGSGNLRRLGHVNHLPQRHAGRHVKRMRLRPASKIDRVRSARNGNGPHLIQGFQELGSHCERMTEFCRVDLAPFPLLGVRSHEALSTSHRFLKALFQQLLRIDAFDPAGLTVDEDSFHRSRRQRRVTRESCIE